MNKFSKIMIIGLLCAVVNVRAGGEANKENPISKYSVWGAKTTDLWAKGMRKNNIPEFAEMYNDYRIRVGMEQKEYIPTSSDRKYLTNASLFV